LDVYNEFSLQHELGVFLRGKLEQRNVQFERNVSFFFSGSTFVKKEIDIAIFSPDKSILDCAIELKFPRNGQYPEQMFSFCRDILFAEQLLTIRYSIPALPRAFTDTFVRAVSCVDWCRSLPERGTKQSSLVVRTGCNGRTFLENYIIRLLKAVK
jgi:hypothetical protein